MQVGQVNASRTGQTSQTGRTGQTSRTGQTQTSNYFLLLHPAVFLPSAAFQAVIPPIILWTL